MDRACYPRAPGAVARGCAVLQSDRQTDSPVEVPPDLPCNVIVVHGVNDVGTSYEQVEQGICEGLTERLRRAPLKPGTYRMPTRDDLGELQDDPDAVFFKRTLPEGHRTPVIPFYWGFRAEKENARSGEQNFHGQNTDRYGNRLDKDFSKGGGPFVNATTTLPDMWGPGAWGNGGIANRLVADPLRPILSAPGRMYMILAAQRLAALVSMIRDWHDDEVVNIVAHSQGCMLSLLAQAFLMKWGLRPADTLVLTHPPYSLVDDVSFVSDVADAVQGGVDARMEKHYASLAGGQTLHARLKTLVDIVQGVAAKKHASPQFSKLGDSTHRGMVGAKWVATQPERDNRGKVYLYFCPEDMTVALDKVQGIGWQGVPNVQEGRQRVASGRLERVRRRPLAELGPAFFQRVFTLKKRPHPETGAPVLVGQARPHDFVLRAGTETGFEHVDRKPQLREELPRPPPESTASGAGSPDEQAALKRQQAIRHINGEPLPRPAEPDMHAGATKPADRPEALQSAPAGAYESIDPIDASTGSTQFYSYGYRWRLVDDLSAQSAKRHAPGGWEGNGFRLASPRPDLHGGPVRSTPHKAAALLERLNQGKPPEKRCPGIRNVYTCLDERQDGLPTGQLLIERLETPEEYRRRKQGELAERSFHGAIFGSRPNHRNVTAYDLSIGGGRASSDAGFYAYLCAVADWRLTHDRRIKRPGILRWDDFNKKYSTYFDREPRWRNELIAGNVNYYSNGMLPAFVPVLPEGLPPSVTCETTSSTGHAQSAKRQQ